eukprot:scaffold76327_cov33-Tisochrysis_lutea.AAC.4
MNDDIRRDATFAQRPMPHNNARPWGGTRSLWDDMKGGERAAKRLKGREQTRETKGKGSGE